MDMPIPADATARERFVCEQFLAYFYRVKPCRGETALKEVREAAAVFRQMGEHESNSLRLRVCCHLAEKAEFGDNAQHIVVAGNV